MSEQKPFSNPRRRRVIARPCGPSRTKQSFKDDCDFNKLLKKFGVTKGLPVGTPAGGFYIDMTEVPSSQKAHQSIIDAHTQFNALPIAVRRKYPTPAALIAALSDPLEVSTLRTLGVTKALPSQLPSSPSKGEASSSGQDEMGGTEPPKPSKKALKSSDSSSSS